jgi:NADPH:quinone reductase-like Zn-dependent oxidoreductase
MTMQTRTVRFHETGGPDVLRIERESLRDPAGDELRVRIEAIGLNRAEAAFRAGCYLEAPILPARIGYEASGIVEAVGASVSAFQRGDPVCVLPAFSMNDYGVYAERAIVPASAVIGRPSFMDALAGAAVWMPYLTAYGAIVEVAGVRAGDHVVITAASSSVGIAAMQIARGIGGIPIAVTRSPEKVEALRANGAAHVIVADREPLDERVSRLSEGRGARLVFDPIGGPFVGQLAPCVGRDGWLVLYGNLSGRAQETVFPFGLSATRGFSMRGYTVFALLHDAGRLRMARTFIEEGLQQRWLSPVIDRVFEFDHIVDAHRHLESNQQVGKILVSLLQ